MSKLQALANAPIVKTVAIIAITVIAAVGVETVAEKIANKPV